MDKQEFMEHIASFSPKLRDLCYSYTEETEKLINEIHYCDTYSQKEWDVLYDKCKDNVYAIYAISTKDTIPKNIINNIVYNDTLYSHTRSAFETDLFYKIYLNLLSQKDIGLKEVKYICEYHSAGLYERLAQLTYDGWQNKINRCEQFPNPNNYCRIPEGVAFIMHEQYMNTPLSEKFKFDWRHMPLRFIHHNTKAIEELDRVENGYYTNKQGEQICAAIANNPNLAYEIRERAMSNISIEDIFFASSEIKKEIYLILADSYYSPEMNLVKSKSKELTPEEKSSLTQTKKALIGKIENGFFSDTELMDMIYRAQNIHNGEYADKVLETIFKTSHNPNLLKLADMLDKRPSVEVAYSNPKMDNEFKEKYISDITLTMPYVIKRDKINFSKARQDAITHIINNVELEKKSSYKTAYRSFLQTYMPEECAKSAFTPREIIQEIINDREKKFDKLYKNIERHNDIDAVDRKSYLHGQLNLLMRDAKFNKEEINNFFKGFEFLCVYNRMDWYHSERDGHHFTMPPPKTSNYIQMDEHIQIAKTLFHLPERKKIEFKELLKDKINNYHKKQPQHILLSQALKTIEYSENIAKAYFYRDFSSCDYKTIEALNSIFKREFIDKVEQERHNSTNCNEAIPFYEELEYYYKASQDCVKALKEYKEKDKNIEIEIEK